MTAKPVCVFCLFFLSTVSLLPANAQTYQWKDAAGRTVISDTPPPASVKERRSYGEQPKYYTGPEKPNDSAPAVDTSKTAAEKELDFKKRQQELREKAEKQAKEQAAENSRRENCERARRNLAALESNQAVTTLDADGRGQVMDASQRALEIERARQFMADTCK